MCHVHLIVGESQSFACRDDNFFGLFLNPDIAAIPVTDGVTDRYF
jgi:hypothetical protein